MVKQSTPSNHNPSRVLGLDVGDVRIGVASVGMIARLPEPIEVVVNDDKAISKISQIASDEDVSTIVVGLPRDQQGLETAQSAKAREFATKLENETEYKIEFADESLSTKRAEAMIKSQGKDMAMLDAYSACFILEEFLTKEGLNG